MSSSGRQSSILIIDDEDKYLELCRRFMPEYRFLPVARNYREAAQVLAEQSSVVDLVLLDVHFEIPEVDLLPADKSGLPSDARREVALARIRRSQGLLILEQLRRTHPDLPVIVMTSRDDLPRDADAHHGSRLDGQDFTYLLHDDYLDARSLKLQIEEILTRRFQQAPQDEPFYWGLSPQMASLRRRLGILAKGRLPIVLLGATGTGKSLLAREFIHPRSQRAGPFVATDLSTIPLDLMAAHLFGVVRGAFTGAHAAREGVLTRADGGTLFLDEIGNLNLELQKSLLLVLQEGRYRPVGAVDEKVADIKLVVATNEDLAQMVREGRFRADLYMRLNPATAVTLPSLRERGDDFEALVSEFMRRVAQEPYNRDLLVQYARQRGLAIPSDDDAFPVRVVTSVPKRSQPLELSFVLHPSSLRSLQEFDWPGNFRQFEMFWSNLLTFTLVDLVDRVDRIEPDDPQVASHPNVIPILPRTVRELLGPMDLSPAGTTPLHAVASPGPAEEMVVNATAARMVTVRIEPAESLHAVSADVERQYLERLYEEVDGDLRALGALLLGTADGARKVQLRMNQLGMRLRELKRRER